MRPFFQCRFKHEKGCKNLIYEALEGQFRKSHIAKRLKQLGLTGTQGRKGQPFSEAQDEHIRQLFEK